MQQWSNLAIIHTHKKKKKKKIHKYHCNFCEPSNKLKVKRGEEKKSHPESINFWYNSIRENLQNSHVTYIFVLHLIMIPSHDTIINHKRPIKMYTVIDGGNSQQVCPWRFVFSGYDGPVILA